MAKSTKIIAALGVVAGLGVAALPLASYAAEHVATATEIQDAITVGVKPSCKFTSDNSGVITDGSYTVDNVENGAAATTIGTHKYNVYCNDNGGYTVTAIATGLTSAVGNIAFVADSEFATNIASDALNKKTGAWTATVTGTPVADDYTINNAIGVDDGKVVTKLHSTTAAGSAFEVTYKVYAGTETKAGTYTGTVTYTLTAAADAA